MAMKSDRNGGQPRQVAEGDDVGITLPPRDDRVESRTVSQSGVSGAASAIGMGLAVQRASADTTADFAINTDADGIPLSNAAA
ncbi:MAG: hypothetical protein HUJ24_08215, partial [Rhodobacteraceae bacterium]|nr:hypothetical protein [Paracoccaceae bacterium]